MKKLLLTVAVPVYNVENYLERCINSLISNHIDNSEILLIDDGSTDSSGLICDRYQKKYNYIRVIHQKNCGLAEVRNRCIKLAKGEFISFVDSDDYLSCNAYSHLMELQKKYDADIICYGVNDLYENRENNQNNSLDSEKILLFSNKTALEEMLLPANIDVITCNKIIRKQLFKDVKYPKGKLYEDMFTNYKIIAKANRIIATNKKYYNYWHRPGSIGQTKFNNKTMDLSVAVNEVYNYGIDFCNSKDNLVVGKIQWEIVVANYMIKGKKIDYKYVKSIQKFSRKNIKFVLKNKLINKIRKIQIVLFTYSLPLYKFFYFIYIKRNR